MKLLHLSDRSNRNSILSHGILRSSVKNSTHLDAFNSSGLIGDQVVYTWSPDYGQSTTKYIKDMIYCKQFIHPRNDMFDKRHKTLIANYSLGVNINWEDDNNWIDFSKIGNTILGGDRFYDLYEIQIDDDDFFMQFIHTQHSDPNRFSTTFAMDDKYGHNDKSIFILDQDIQPANIKIVSEISSKIFNNTIHITETSHD